MWDDASERAQTYLRLLAEAAVRAATMRQDRVVPQASEPEAAAREAAERVSRAADILIDSGILDDRQATEILLMLATALRLRGVDWRVSPSRTRMLAGAASRAASATAPPWLVIPAWTASSPAGQPTRSRVMALIVTADRVIAPAMLRFPEPGPADRSVPSFADLIATDDAGTGYMVSFTDGAWTSGTWTGTLMLRPRPPGNARILTITSPNGPVLRVPLTPAAVPGPAKAGRTEPTKAGGAETGGAEPAETGGAEPAKPGGAEPAKPGGAEPAGQAGSGSRAEGEVVASCEVTGVPDSPGERLLTRWAEALVAALAAGGQAGVTAMAKGATQARDLEWTAVIETLEAAGAISPLSPVRARLNALRERAGTASTSWSAHQPLPVRWSSVLAYYARRRHGPVAQGALTAGLGAIGAILPTVDGAWLVAAGVHATSELTLLHVVARGVRMMSRPSSASPAGGRLAPAHDSGLSWWVRDAGGTWHLGVVHAWHPASEDTVLRLALLPPLRPGAPGTSSTLMIEVTGTSQQLTASVRVHW